MRAIMETEFGADWQRATLHQRCDSDVWSQLVAASVRHHLDAASTSTTALGDCGFQFLGSDVPTEADALVERLHAALTSIGAATDDPCCRRTVARAAETKLVKRRRIVLNDNDVMNCAYAA